MEKQQLFENEEIIASSDDHAITLTNRRIRQNKTSFGKADITSIHLEKISAIEISYKSWLLALIAGILLACAGLVLSGQRNQDGMVSCLAAGLVCILFYIITRQHLITITSDGGTKMRVLIKGMKQEKVLDFIYKIETAKSLIK